jgi:prepilin-type N-terminal cleavage/methylation domain-containing protein
MRIEPRFRTEARFNPAQSGGTGLCRIRRERSSRQSAFTLLEVMVAVGVLGLLYTVLAGIAMDGLRAEGETGRRLRASLLADLSLHDLEAGLDLGATPPLGRQEQEQDEFVITVDVSEWELPLPAETGDDPSPPASLIRRSRGARSSPLRRIDVHVSWTEGVSERSVTRTSFGLDLEAAAAALDSLPSSEQSELPEEDAAATRDPDEEAE